MMSSQRLCIAIMVFAWTTPVNAQDALGECRAGEPIHLEEVVGGPGTVRAFMPGVYGADGVRALPSYREFIAVTNLPVTTHRVSVRLIPVTGTNAPGRRALLGEDERFDFGPIPPGRYFVRVEFFTMPPLLGEIVVGSAPAVLCIPPLRPSGAIVPGPTAARGPRQDGPFVPTVADSAAVGDAIGRFWGSTPDDSSYFAVLGGANALLDAARRGFMVARGDSVPPPSTAATTGKRSSMSVDSVEFVHRDSVLVTVTSGRCDPNAGTRNMSGNTVTTILRRGTVSTTWMVTLPTGRAGVFHGRCS